MNNPRPPSTEWRFPREPGSESDLLAASHIFTVTLLKQSPTAWLPQPDGLEHRELAMVFRLEAILKGGIRLAPGQEFSVAVPQVREPGDMVSDYHGFWSHLKPATGEKYLVLASGSTGHVIGNATGIRAEDAAEDPAALLKEPTIRSLHPAVERSDFDFAEAEEKALHVRLVDGDSHQHAVALLDLAKAAYRERGKLGVLAASYLMARMATGELREGALPGALLDIILAPDTSPDLRNLTATGLCDKAKDQGATPKQRALLAGAIFRLDANPSTAELLKELVDAELYNLIFEEDAPLFHASEAIPDKGRRAKAAALLKGFEEEQTDVVAAWLDR